MDNPLHVVQAATAATGFVTVDTISPGLKALRFEPNALEDVAIVEEVIVGGNVLVGVVAAVALTGSGITALNALANATGAIGVS
jgi:hypothetical protein